MNKPQTYMVRWKGQQFGPFTKEAIEQKVREHELSLAHEIQVDGKWRALRGFLNLQAQTQEQDRQKIRLKRMQDELDEKQVALQDAKAEIEQVKKRPPVTIRQEKAEEFPSQSPVTPKSRNPIDQLIGKFKQKQ